MKREIATSILIEKIARDMYPARAPGQIQPLQWAILRAIDRCEERQRMVSWVAKNLGLTSGPVSRAVSTLVSRGFLEQRPCEEDQRITLLALTASGQSIMQNDPLLRVASILSDLAYDEIRAFTNVLEKVVVRMETDLIDQNT